MKNRRLGWIILVGVLAVNLTLAVRLYSQAKEEKDSAYANVQLLTRVMEVIRQDYVEQSKTDYKDLTYSALRGMLASLDPHSQFMDPESFTAMQKETKGEFGGLGIVVGLKDNVLTVIAPMEDTPAAKAGLLAGDRIIKIDGKTTEKWAVEDAVKVLRGEPGSKVTLTIMRPKSREVKDYVLERDIIKVTSVKDDHNRGISNEKSFQLGADKIGYIRIAQFNEPTAEEFEKALRKLEAQGMEALIIDLRNNPGGLLDSAKEIVSRFLPAGQLIVYTEGRQLSQRAEYRASSFNKHPHYPIVVIINGGSASGAEIVAGALQDLKRAVVVGETSFGKGSVQSVLPLKDGEGRDCALRLTTAKYYTPSKRVIHERGITPDILVPLTEEEERKLAETRAQLIQQSEEPTEDGQKAEPARDRQLERAVDVLKGIRVFNQQAKSKMAFGTKPVETRQ
jgi:carboxyl-terminal processing protease